MNKKESLRQHDPLVRISIFFLIVIFLKYLSFDMFVLHFKYLFSIFANYVIVIPIFLVLCLLRYIHFDYHFFELRKLSDFIFYLIALFTVLIFYAKPQMSGIYFKIFENQYESLIRKISNDKTMGLKDGLFDVYVEKERLSAPFIIGI